MSITAGTGVRGPKEFLKILAAARVRSGAGADASRAATIPVREGLFSRKKIFKKSSKNVLIKVQKKVKKSSKKL